MRMDQRSSRTAKEIINTYSEQELYRRVKSEQVPRDEQEPYRRVRAE